MEIQDTRPRPVQHGWLDRRFSRAPKGCGFDSRQGVYGTQTIHVSQSVCLSLSHEMSLGVDKNKIQHNKKKTWRPNTVTKDLNVGVRRRRFKSRHHCFMGFVRYCLGALVSWWVKWDYNIHLLGTGRLNEDSLQAMWTSRKHSIIVILYFATIFTIPQLI